MAAKRQQRPPPRLGGVYEVAYQLSISASSLSDRRRGFDFPEPIARLRCGPIWDLDDIDTYIERRRRDPSAAYRWENQPGRFERHLHRYPNWGKRR